MPQWWVVALALGAALRINRFVTADLLGSYVRQGWWAAWERAGHGGRHGNAAQFIGCSWCVGVWVAAVVVAAALLLGDTLWFTAPALALTISYVVGLASHIDQ